MAIQLYLVGNDEEQPVEIQIENGGIVTDMTFQLIDIRDITSSLDDVTKNVKIKGSKQNNLVLGSMFGLDRATLNNISNKLLFNYSFSKQVQCLVYENDELISRGYFRLLKVTPKGGTYEYDAVIVGYRSTFFSKLKDSKLSDLEYTELNHFFDYQNIIDSLDNTEGYVYPLIDYGAGFVPDSMNAGNLATWDYRNYRPSIFLSTYFKKIFENRGYSFKVDGYFNNVFKKLVIPSTVEKLTSFRTYHRNIITNDQVKFGNFYDDMMSEVDPIYLTFPDFTADDIILLYEPYQLSTDRAVEMDVDLYFSFRDSTVWDINPSAPNQMKLDSYVEYDVDLILITKKFNSDELVQRAKSTTKIKKYYDTNNQVYEMNLKTRIDFPAYERVMIQMVLRNIDVSNCLSNNAYTKGSNDRVGKENVSCTSENGSLTLGSHSNNTKIFVDKNDMVIFDKNNIPDIKQIDLIQSVVNMFKLVCYTSNDNPKEIIFKTFDEYFDDALPQNLINNALDWSNKIDLDSFVITPIADIAKTYRWKYSPGEDWLNKEYSNLNQETYGQKTLVTNNEFKEDVKEVESLFAGTPIPRIANNVIYPCIYKYSDNWRKETYKSEPRLLIYQGKKTLSTPIQGGLYEDYSYVEVPSFYPDGQLINAVGEVTTIWNDTINNKKFDLVFGTPFNVYDGRTEMIPTLYDTFFNRFILESNHTDAHIIDCDIFLNSVDIFNLNLGKPVYISTDNGGAYYRVLSIEYKTKSISPSKAKLQKIII